MAKNVQGVLFLRNGSLYATREAALADIKLKKGLVADGQFILARYGSGSDVKTLVGVKYGSGSTENDTLTIFDIEGASSDVRELREQMEATFGTGVTSANTATAQFAALSGNAESTSAETSVAGAKKYADQKISDAISSLDYSDSAVAGEYVSQVTEADGKIAVTRAALPTVAAISEAGKPITAVSESAGAVSATAGTINAEFVDIADAGGIITATNVEGALAEIAAEIDAMDKSASAVDGQVVTTVSETDGVVSETKANVKDLQLGGYTKDTTATGDIASTDTINAALSKLENKAAAITIANADGSIIVTNGASGTDVAVHIKTGENVIKLDGEGGGIYTNLNVVKITGSTLPAEIKERYELRDSDNVKIGESIDIPKDSHIVSITYITGGTHAQNLEYVYIDASGNTQTTYVDMSELVLEAEFASGVTATDHVVHGVVDPASETFLTVGADGFKLAGVQNAIDSAINALDVTGDTAVAGQYVAAIEETNGVVAVKTRANVSEAVLNNYSKDSDSGAVASTDTINQAISKLENQIGSKVDALDSTVSGETADGKVKVQVVQENGVLTAVTVTGTDIASDAALAQLSGKTITAVTSTNSSISASLSNEPGNKTVDIQTDASKIKMTGFTSTGALSGITSSDSITGAFGKVEDVIEDEIARATAAEEALDGRLDAIESGYVGTVKVNNVALAETDNAVNVQISGSTAAGNPVGNEAITVVTDPDTGAVTLGLGYIDCGTY